MQRHSALHLPPKPVLTITEPTNGELEALDRAQRYDCLTSIHLFDGVADHKRAYKRLLKAQALRIPSYFFDYARRKNVYYPLELDQMIGPRLLAHAGRWIARDRGPDHPAHKLYRSTIEFFFDHGPKVEGLSVKMLEDLPGYNELDEETAHKIPLYKDGKDRWHYLVPDLFRGYTYDNGIATASMYFHGEADRANEPGTAEATRQTLTNKIANYDRYFDADGPKERYGVRNITVLWVTTTEARKRQLLKHLKQSKFPKRHAVKVFPDYKEFPPLTDIMVSQPWERAEGGPLDILKVLRETAERKSNGSARASGEGRGAIEGDQS